MEPKKLNFFGTRTLFVAERDHGIHAQRAARRDVTGERGDCDEKQGHVGEWIQRAGIDQQSFQ